MIEYDTIIAGGGPSGMTAALQCARKGQRVLLIDRGDRIGKKILVTGNGKCNLTNVKQNLECYRGEDPKKISKILSAFGQQNAMELFHQLGICTREKNGYIYPYNEQAAAVRDAFECAIVSNENISIWTESSVTGVQKEKQNFLIFVKNHTQAKEKKLLCKSFIIATGGLAGIKLGCNGTGYAIAKAMGHHIVPPYPALTALKSAAPFLKKINGVRNQAAITLLVDGKEVCKERGELQWTAYGISGVAVFQISRYAVVALEEKKQVCLSLDFMPDYTEKQTEEILLSCCKTCSYKTYEQLLCGILPAKLVPIVLREASIQMEKRVHTPSTTQIHNLVKAIKTFCLRISGYVGYEKAQVTRGGVDMKEVSSELESVLCEGLFFAGEVLDVDGTCGGYNLQWAFSSGSVAGQAAWKRNQKINSTL